MERSGAGPKDWSAAEIRIHAQREFLKSAKRFSKNTRSGFLNSRSEFLLVSHRAAMGDPLRG
ncbi:hypothetical protein ACIQUX_25240, partial [Streptomyces sp. NPDC101133]|uniref:hypothetical protein n=1 Tax=Streptomyces sp. NPDC101133 TaxID=3366111 RepID=UPI003802951B